MKKILLVTYLLLSVFISILSVNADEIDSCKSVDQCIKRIYEVASPETDCCITVSQKEWSVARRIAQFGDEAAARLVPLLKDSNDDVAQIAAAALREIKQIDTKHLSAIIEALDSKKELDWLPPALGRINSPLAAKEAVKRFIGSKSAPHNQEAYAIHLLGIGALPYIIKAAECDPSCVRDQHDNLGYVLGEMDAVARTEAARLLMRSVSSGSTSDKNKEGMIYMISLLKDAALVVEQELVALKKENNKLKNVINQALISMKSKHAGAIFADLLRDTKPDPYLLSDLAEVGEIGIDAGPRVTELLHHADWDIRLAAARCLGYINYRESVPNLIKLLDEPSDVRLNWTAAESLGRLADKTALSSLRHMAKTHWHPAVRKAALKSIRHIESAVNNYKLNNNYNFTGNFFDFNYLSTQVCKKNNLKQIKEHADTKMFAKYSRDKGKLQTLSYPSEIISYAAADKEEQLAAQDGEKMKLIEIRPDNMIEKHTPITQTPDVALRTKNGWLAGSSRGEFGGELVYIADGKQAVTILKDNIENIYRLGERYIAIAGLCHMLLNRGIIYELISDLDGSWSYQPWRTLPGHPSSSWIVETGELLINTNGGSILLSHEGSMRMVPCR